MFFLFDKTYDSLYQLGKSNVSHYFKTDQPYLSACGYVTTHITKSNDVISRRTQFSQRNNGCHVISMATAVAKSLLRIDSTTYIALILE